MLIEELDPHSGVQWDDYIQRHPASTCYHDRAWQTVAQRAYRLPTRYLVARSEPGGRIRGALPLFRVKGMVRAHMTNGLFGAYASALADDGETRTALLGRALELVEDEGLPYFVLKTLEGAEPEVYPGFHRLDSWVIASLGLDPDPGRLWHGFRDKIRNCVRKAIRSGLEVRAGHDQLANFYDVLAENMHRKGSPIYGWDFMRHLAAAFGERSEVVTLWHDDEVVAGALLLFHRDTAYVPFASARPDWLQMSPNNLLYWEIIRRCCLRGMKTLDFGRSLKSSGPLAFKLGWGARTQPQPLHVHAPRGDVLRVDPKQKGVDWFVNQWKRLPRPVADSLGPYVCRQVAGLL